MRFALLLFIVLLFPSTVHSDDLTDLKKTLTTVQAQMKIEKANAGFAMRELNAIAELKRANVRFTALQQKESLIKKRIKDLQEKANEGKDQQAPSK